MILLLGSLKSLVDSVPVDKVVDEVGDVRWALVLLVNVVSVLPAADCSLSQNSM